MQAQRRCGRHTSVFALIACALFFATVIRAAAADAEQDWQDIVALDAGPGQSTPWKTRDEARRAALAHFDRQEKALRKFVAEHPGDSRAVDAQLRLAHLLATRGELAGSEKARAESAAVLARLERDPSTPKDRKADIEFARISLFMRRVDASSEAARAALVSKAEAFQKAFPNDRRNAALLAEVATLYDSEPRRKQALLEAARARGPDEELRQRIDDDLKRLAMLGRPVAMQWTSHRGEAVDVAKLRGKVVLIYFFASWSPPAMAGLDWVRELAARFPAKDVQALGISLDENKAALERTLAARKIDWPIHFDGQGWTSPLVRSLGINSLPTLWILDRSGNLRTLNARAEAETVVTRLLRER